MEGRVERRDVERPEEKMGETKRRIVSRRRRRRRRRWMDGENREYIGQKSGRGAMLTKEKLTDGDGISLLVAVFHHLS